MIITRHIETVLDITNPIEIYSDPDNNILNILRDKYEGKCYSNCFILKVKKIIKRSECIIQQNTDTCNGSVACIFEVDAIIYRNDEVISGCLVKNKDKQGLIIASSQYASICLNSQDIFNAVRNDLIIPVRVGKARYNILSDKISVNAVPYVPNNSYIYYYIGNYNHEAAQFNDIITKIGEEEAKMAEIKKKNIKGWSFFSTILYPYKDKQTIKSKTVSVKDMALRKNAEGYYCRDPKIHMSENLVTVQTGVPNADNVTIVKELDAAAIILHMLYDYFDGMRIIREFVEIYNTENLMHLHKPLWAIYNKLKT